MSISLIVMLGLPVLYLTGNLKDTVRAMRISGKAFVVYFLSGAVLSMLPSFTLLPVVSLNLVGAFLCIAPLIYLAYRKDCGYRFLLASMLSVLLSVSMFYLTSSSTLPYLQALTGAAIAFLSLACFGRGAAPRAPVLAGLYGVSENIMALLTGQVRMMRLFSVPELAVLCFFFCFTVTGVTTFFRSEKAGSPTPEVPDLPDTEFPKPEYPKPKLPEPEIPEPDFPGPEFPEPKLPKPEFPKPEIKGPPFPGLEFPKPEAIKMPPSQPKPNES